jgi:type IV pilus assembly protein PilB
MTKKENQQLISALVQQKILNRTQADNFINQAQSVVNTEGITQALIKSFNLDEHEVDEIIANEFNIPFLYSSDGLQWVDVPDLPDEASAKYRFIPIIIEDLELTVAFVDPPYARLIELLENATHRQIVPVVITPSAFDMLLMNRSKEVQKQVVSRFDFEVIDVEKRGEKWATSKDTVQKLPSANIVFTKLMEAAFDNQASHIHFETTKKGFLTVRFRLQSIIQRVVTLPSRYTSTLPSLVKQICRVEETQGGRPLKGKAILKIKEQKVNGELNVIPTGETEKLTLKLTTNKTNFLNIDEIGLSEHDKARFHYIVNKSGTIVLFCGPPQSGKSTTMYSIIQRFNNPDKHIASLDMDEIEFLMDGLLQMVYTKAEGLTFQDAMKALIDHNLDILAVDAVSDKSKFELALELINCNAQVFSTIDAVDTQNALHKLTTIFDNREYLTTAIRGIISQKLVRKICPVCSEKYRPKPDVLELMGLRNLPQDVMLSRGGGCSQCSGTGYLGVIPVFETFYFSDSMKLKFSQGCSVAELMQEAEKSGFTNMTYDGLRKVLRGLTTIDEIIRQM